MTLNDIEPAALRVATRLPDQLAPRKDGVFVKIRIAASQRDEAFVLEAVTEPGELSALANEQQNGSQIWVYRLSASDTTRLQKLISTSSGGAAVTISAGVDACRRKTQLSGPLLTTTYLSSQSGGYMPLTRDLDLRGLVAETDLAANVPLC
jgi:hypothetical protein